MGKPTRTKKTSKYTNEFKVKAVQLTLLEYNQVKDIAQALDIHPAMLSRWRMEYNQGLFKIDRRKKVF